MKNKLFWPIVIVAIVVIIESVLLLSNKQFIKSNDNGVEDTVIPTEEVKEVEAVSFEWMEEDGKATLILTANKAVAIDAIDLYIDYKNAKVKSVKNLDELPKPTFSKISTEKSLVVMNYLISDSEGFKLEAGQSVKITELEVTVDSVEAAEFFIDTKTQVVENGTAKVLPFNSKNLTVNSTL